MEEVTPIPFVIVGDDGSFSVNPEACQRLEVVKGKIVVIAVAGLYRTGKSFLLNLLVNAARAAGIEHQQAIQLGEKVAGFAVGGTVNACTKGIWMWGQPIIMDDGTNYLFLDTEGLGSTDREQTHDTRIFALALLLATNFIYNSRGVIDGNAIEDLSLVVNLSKHIQTSSNSSDSNDSGSSKSSTSDLSEFFPTFMWVVRDFTLQLQENGKKISSRQYLENALKPQGGYSDDAMQKDQIRLLLSDFFRQRDCVTMVRPVDNEDQLRSLPTLPYDELRPEFRTSFESLKKKIFDKAKPKMLYGKVLNGNMYVNLVQSYVGALNSGKAPVISSAWSRVVEAQCEQAVIDAISTYKKEASQRITKFTTPERYENDLLARQYNDEIDFDEIDEGQGDSAMFDANGNLKRIPNMPDQEDITDADDGDIIDVNEDITSNEKKTIVESTLLPCDENVLRQVHRYIKKKAKASLKDLVDTDLSDDVAEYLNKFRVEIEQEFARYKQLNAAASMQYCRFVCEKLSRSAEAYIVDPVNRQKSADAIYKDTQQFLKDEVHDIHSQYFAQAVGPSADAAFCEFMTQGVLTQVIQRTETTNAAHMEEVRDLEAQVNDLSVKVAIAQGQATAMRELGRQQQASAEAGVKDAEAKAHAELKALHNQLDHKTKELEHVLSHNATLKKLADSAQQGHSRATNLASTALASVLAGYMIKQESSNASFADSRGQKRQANRFYQKYFVLANGKLFMYETKDDYEQQRTDSPPMDLRGARIEDGFAVPEAFSITFAGYGVAPVVLHAKSLGQKREWVENLRKVSGTSSAASTLVSQSSVSSNDSAASSYSSHSQYQNSSPARKPSQHSAQGYNQPGYNGTNQYNQAGYAANPPYNPTGSSHQPNANVSYLQQRLQAQNGAQPAHNAYAGNNTPSRQTPPTQGYPNQYPRPQQHTAPQQQGYGGQYNQYGQNQNQQPNNAYTGNYNQSQGYNAQGQPGYPQQGYPPQGQQYPGAYQQQQRGYPPTQQYGQPQQRR